MDTSKIILVTGGARSGKSAFAERYAAALPGRHAYVATARIFDEEMAQRIAIHRKRKQKSKNLLRGHPQSGILKLVVALHRQPTPELSRAAKRRWLE